MPEPVRHSHVPGNVVARTVGVHDDVAPRFGMRCPVVIGKHFHFLHNASGRCYFLTYKRARGVIVRTVGVETLRKLLFVGFASGIIFGINGIT